jgi:chorismate synthase
MFRFLTAGESHGRGLATIVEGIPAGLPLDEEYIAHDLKRRQAGYGRGERMQIEDDRAEILSGVRHGLTIGSPIALLIWNRDWENWKDVMSVTPAKQRIEPLTRLRPGHADLAGTVKYGFDDIRPILERASARETAARVAAGAVARRFVAEFRIDIRSHTIAIGNARLKEVPQRSEQIGWAGVDKSPLRCSDGRAEKAMIGEIDKAKAAGNSIGGVFQVVATGVPIGLGSHAHWDRRLDGRIAQAMMSIPAVKGVGIGLGFATTELMGSEAHDIIKFDRKKKGWSHETNRAGGVEGGISNGEPITVMVAIKPIPTMIKPLPSADLKTGGSAIAHVERSDICVVPAAGVIGEAMLAIVLADALLEKFGGDNMKETIRNYKSYIDSITKKA